MVSSQVPAGQRRTTPSNTRTDPRPGPNSSRRGRPLPSLHGRRADTFTDALPLSPGPWRALNALTVHYAALMDQGTADLATAIGARVRQVRQSRRWTLDQLAEVAGVSRRMVV